MSRRRHLLNRLLIVSERRFDLTRRRWRRRLGITRPYEIVPYLGYGSTRRLFLRGRVLEDKSISLASDGDTRWRNLVNTYKRFVSDEVPGARIKVSVAGLTWEAVTDAKGYFYLSLELEEALEDRRWHEVTLQLLAPKRDGHSPVFATALVLVPPGNAEFGVISDMDDTVVQTGATKWLRVVRTVLFGNARTRLPFKGVAAFYRALQEGSQGDGSNPLFYVSSSPWNLYDLLLEFLRIEDIPLGPLILRNWRANEDELIPFEHGSFKKHEIRRILETFPKLPFILIGDSGQEDPEIYRDIVHDYPGRILAIYIRNVSGASARSQDVAALAEMVREAGSRLILADDTLAAARHAAGKGWICPQALLRVRERKRQDETIFARSSETATVIEEADAVKHES